MWKQVRGGTYATGAVGFIALLAAGMGYIDYDPQTGLITIPPFTVQALVAAVPGILSPPLALLALIKGWGGKTQEPQQ